MEHARIKAAQRAFYEAGTYSALGACLRPAAEALVQASGVGHGDRVLDVGSGDGNVSLAALAAGATVVASDISAVQVARTRDRAGGRGGFAAADVERLPFADATFNAVLSSFGAVIATDPETATSEMFRVCRPGGAVALTAWPPDSRVGEINSAVRASAREPDAFVDQELGWGVEAVACERFAVHADVVEFTLASFVWDAQLSASAGSDDCRTAFLTNYDVLRDQAALSVIRVQIIPRHTDRNGVEHAGYALLIGRKRS